MFDCRYKLDYIGASWCKLEWAKEKKRGVKPQSSWLDRHPVDWIGTSSKLDWNLANWILRQKLQNSNKEGSSRLDDDPGNWINCPESVKNSRIQINKDPVDWMVIQATGLINPNRAKSPWGILMKIQSTGLCSRLLD